MNEYVYTARAADGRTTNGTVTAYSEDEARRKVQAQFSYKVTVEVKLGFASFPG